VKSADNETMKECKKVEMAKSRNSYVVLQIDRGKMLFVDKEKEDPQGQGRAGQLGHELVPRWYTTRRQGKLEGLGHETGLSPMSSKK